MFAHPVDLIMEKHRRLEDEASDEVASEPTIEEARLYRSYNLLIQHVPLVKSLDESGHDTALDGLCANLMAGSANSRGDDAGKMKAVIVTWLNAAHGPSDPPLRENSKDERGFSNIITGGLLRPAIIRTFILDGNTDYTVTAQDWPAFCYANNNCNLDNIQDGLFRGPLLVKAFKFLLTCPSLVNDTDMEPLPSKCKKQATRSNVSTLIGLKSVSSGAIAYVALQLRFSLSDTSSWKSEDSQFDNQEFYYAIVDYFNDTPGPKAEEHVKELLAWWNTGIQPEKWGSADCCSQCDVISFENGGAAPRP
ncbi:hypothetical protein FIBSPDRAFT_963669 [Athelia psychrophila]|uniref:Uncharacterized protein n=1 Tax=Athelia psychrophila TaxID=1759441 RepID=A0A165YQE3_9AGAM|nr:hypothetical protein FIBSPDRAFT_963669 [Fibularhizoctonia sp. CBS 109695]